MADGAGCRAPRAHEDAHCAADGEPRVTPSAGRPSPDTPKRPRLNATDRLFWIGISRLCADWRSWLVIVQPETVVGWHRSLFRAFWTWKIRHGKPGRPGVPKDTRELIRRMSRENPTWGAPRIHGELLKLGIEIAESSVSKYLVRARRPPSQTWRTFLQNHISSMVSVDFFTVPTVRFQVLYVFLVLAHERRRIVHVGVTLHPTAEWTVQQLREAFPWDSAPRYMLRDRDRIFGREFVDQVKQWGSSRYCRLRAPMQRAYVERVIGTIRRECLDHVIIFGERDLRRWLRVFIEHYHRSRTHLSLGKDAPEPRPFRTAARDV